jgi:hypothetical protein
MEKDTKQMVLFKDLFHKPVEIDFDGGNVSSDAGLLFISQYERKLGIIKHFCESLADRRHPSYITHELTELMRQRVFQIISGYPDGNDSDALRKDPVFKMVCGQMPKNGKDLASQPTFSRLENAPSRTDLYRMGQATLDGYVASKQSPPVQVILDIDDTDDITHGHQQLSLFNAFHGDYCYMPIHVYDGETGDLVMSVLRPGKRPSGKEISMILKRIVARIRKAWPKVHIIVRGDGNYGVSDVMDFCESHNLQYVFGFTGYAPVLRKAKYWVREAKIQYNKRHRMSKSYGEFPYRAKEWKQARRVIVKAEHSKKGPNTRFVVTSLKRQCPKNLYKKRYCPRGKMELYIKEHKVHLQSDRTSCSSFQANQFRLFMHSLAYRILHSYRVNVLKATGFAKSQFDTIRLHLIKIGARILELATRVKVHLPTSFAYQADIRILYAECCGPG